MGKITEITFSLGKTTPLNTYTGVEEDRYASVKPHVSAKMEFDEPIDAKTLNEKYNELRDICFKQLTDFHSTMIESFKGKR